MTKSIAIYPGSFDPVTNGHMDMIKRGLRLFDHLIVAILHNPAKRSALFSVDDRVAMLKEIFKDDDNIEVDAHSGLLVDYAEQKNATAILRGLRATSDFEYEFQMALMNRRLNRNVQTVFLMSGLQWIFTSSSIVKEAATFGGDIKSMVPPLVNEKLKERFAKYSV